MDIIGYVYDGAMYCLDHEPKGDDINPDEVGAVFDYHENTGYDNTCDVCHEVVQVGQESEKGRALEQRALDIVEVYGDNQLRHCIFQPPCTSPRYHLWTYDTGDTMGTGQHRIAYVLKAYHRNHKGKLWRETLFAGEDFGTPGVIDSDDCVAGIMGFLTLQPGDTDKEYFADYSERQKNFARGDAEYLGYEVIQRYGER